MLRQVERYGASGHVTALTTERCERSVGDLFLDRAGSDVTEPLPVVGARGRSRWRR